MLGLKEICSLFAAGGLGATSVVAVQHVRPSPRPAIHRSAARPATVPRPAPAAPRMAAPVDCLPASAAGPIAGLDAFMPMPSLGGSPDGPDLFPGGPVPDAGWSGGGGGGGGSSDGGGFTPPAPAPVPEPASWAMMVSGFGLIGLALRRAGGDQAARGTSAGPKNS